MNFKPQQPRQIQESIIFKDEGFDYTSLDAEAQSVVQQCANEIKRLIKRTAQDIIEIGQKLIEAKERLGHGQFEDWLIIEFHWKLWTARKFMQVARQFKSVNFTDLSIAPSALYLLAAPSTPAIVRQEALERAKQGEAITHSKVKTITSQYKKPAESNVSEPFTNIMFAEDTEQEEFTKSTAGVEALRVRTLTPAVLHPQVHFIEVESATPYLQADDCSLDMYPVTDNDDCSHRDQEETEVQQLFRVGHLLCINDLKHQEGYKWFGHVAEVKQVSTNDIEVVIRVSLESTIK